MDFGNKQKKVIKPEYNWHQTRTYMHPGDNPTKRQKYVAALGFSADVYPFFLALPENVVNELDLLLKSDMDHEQIIETMQGSQKEWNIYVSKKTLEGVIKPHDL